MDKLKLEVQLGLIDKILKPLKAISAGSGETAKALKATKEQLKDLNRAQENISAFQKVSKDASITANTLKTAQAEVKRIRQEIDKVPVPTRDMARAMKEAKEQAAKLKEEHNGLIVKQQRLRDVLKGSGIETSKLNDKQRELKAQMATATGEIGKQSAALEVLNRRQNSLRNARYAYDKTIGVRNKMAMAGATTTAAGVAMGMPILKTIKEFAIAEDAVTQLKVAMMKVGGQVPEEFQRINDLARELGNKLPGTTADYQNMMTMLIRQGMPAEKIIGGLGKATAYLGVQLRMPMEAAAEFASKLQDATRTSQDEMMGLMDTIQRVSYLGVESDNMLQAFTKLSPALSMIKKQGLDAAKAFAPLIVMADQAGMRGEAAGNAYRKVFQFALDAKKLAKANDALDGTGKHLDFSNGKGEFGGMDKLFANLDKLKSLNTMKRNSVIKELFGDDAETLQVVSLIIDKGKAGYEDVQAKMAAQADIQRRVNEQLGTLKSLWDAASGTFTNALVALGEAISPEVKAVVQWIGELSEKLGAWAKENPELANGIMKTAAILAITVTGLGALMLAAAAVLGPLALLKLSMTMIPGAGAVLSWLNPLAKLTAAFAAGYALGTLINVGISAALSHFMGEGTTLGTAIYDLVQFIKLKLGELWQWFSGLPMRFIEAGKSLMIGLGDGIMSGLGYVKDKITGAGTSMIGWFKEKLGIHSPSRVFAALGGFTMQGLSDGLHAARHGPLNAVRTTAKQLAAIGAGVAIGGSAFAGQDIKWDNRPPINQSQAMASGSTTTNYFTINAAPGMNEQQLAQLVAREIEKLNRQQAANSRSRLTDRD